MTQLDILYLAYMQQAEIIENEREKYDRTPSNAIKMRIQKYKERLKELHNMIVAEEKKISI